MIKSRLTLRMTHSRRSKNLERNEKSHQGLKDRWHLYLPKGPISLCHLLPTILKFLQTTWTFQLLFFLCSAPLSETTFQGTPKPVPDESSHSSLTEAECSPFQVTVYIRAWVWRSSIHG